MHRIGGERKRLDLDAFVEVEPIHSWAIQLEAAALASAFQAASTPADEYKALAELVDYFVKEAQPQWDFVDHHGPVPPNGRGMMRLPLATTLYIIGEWQATLVADVRPVEDADAPSAVDALIPPGPARARIKRELAKKRAAA